MTFNDILKSSFLEKAAEFSFLDVGIAMVLAFAIGMFILMVHKKTFRGVMYSQSFGVSLMALTLVTTLVILAVTSNVILSLGMVGALSIVRFRSAIKEPIDIAFLFWAIAAGIVVGAGLIPLAVVGSLIIGLIMVLFVNKKSKESPYIVVVSCENSASEKAATDLIASKVKKHVVKSKTVSATTGVEVTVEIRLNEMETNFVNEISQISGVRNAVLVSYNGDYMN